MTSGHAKAEGYTYRRHLNKPIYAELNFADKTASAYNKDLTFISPAGCHYVETPLILQGQQKMEIEIEMTAPTKAEITLQSFQVYLPTNTRQEFLSAPRLTPLKLLDVLEIKKEQIEDVTSVPLQFNLPVQSLGIIDSDFESVRLLVNGQTRFEGTMKEIQAINSFLTTTTDKENRIHFGLEDETFHFGGAFNMSRMDSVELEVTNADKKNMSIVAEYYNVLKYQDGKYSLLFMD